MKHYLAVSDRAVSSVLIRETDKIQKPVYYISKALLDAETRYPLHELVALSLVTAARKLRPYFQTHPIKVYTGHTLKQILQRPEVSGRLVKWSVELSEHDITYLPRAAVKGQALADFVAECTDPQTLAIDEDKWEMSVDGSASTQGNGAGIVLKSDKGEEILLALKFAFTTTNNEAEYEAILGGLRL